VRKGVVVVVIWILPLLVWGQNELLNDFLVSSPVTADNVSSRFDRHVSHLKSKQNKKELALLHKIFRSTQQRFLKTYKPYEPFSELFVSGKYDCLTATSLYTLLLREFHFDYSIIETNYHIFLLVHTSQGDVLLETTDRFNGFVRDKDEIEKRIGSYKQNVIASTDSKLSYYHYSFDLYQKINTTQLTGLLHFNQAVSAFNNRQWKACADQLDEARKRYDSKRVKELAFLLIQSVMTNDVEEPTKQQIIQRFKKYWLPDNACNNSSATLKSCA
jgi:hypothetical protein